MLLDFEALREGIARLSQKDADLLTWKYLEGRPDAEFRLQSRTEMNCMIYSALKAPAITMFHTKMQKAKKYVFLKRPKILNC